MQVGFVSAAINVARNHGHEELEDGKNNRSLPKVWEFFDKRMAHARQSTFSLVRAVSTDVAS